MKTSQLKTLSVAAKKPEKEFLLILSTLLNEDLFDINKFLEALKNKKLILPPLLITHIGLKFSKGNDSYPQNIVIAFQLYQLSANLNCPEGNFNLAHYHFDGRAGVIDLVKASQHAERARNLKYAAADYLAGCIYKKNGQFKLAYECFKRVEKSSKNYYLATYEVALIEIKQSKFEDGTKTLKKVIDESENQVLIEKSYKEIETLLKKAFSAFTMGKPAKAYPKALLIAKALAKINYTSVYFLKGEIALFEGKAGDAIRNFRKVVITDPQFEEAQTQINFLYQQELDSLYEEKESKVDKAAVPLPQVELTQFVLKIKENRWQSLNADIDGFSNQESEAIDYIRNFHAGFNLNAESADKNIFQQQIDLIESQLKRFQSKEEIASPLAQNQIPQLEKQLVLLKETLAKHQKEAHQNLENLKKIADPMAKNLKRQAETEQRFFNAKRLKLHPKQATKTIAKEFLANRLQHDHTKMTSVIVDGQPARRLISAERSIQETAVELFEYPEGEFQTELGFYPNPKNKKSRTYEYSGTFEVEYSNSESVQIGPHQVVYKQRVHPSFNRLGDCEVISLGTYAGILATINFITNKAAEQEKALARLMQRFNKEGAPMTYDEVASLSFPEKNLEELEEYEKNSIADAVSKINQICYLAFIKEPSQWWLAKKEEFRNLPLATSQARALLLLSEGYLRMKDVFARDAPFGVFTGSLLVKQSGLKEMQGKIQELDRLYNEFLKQKHFPDYISFFKSNPLGVIVPTRREIRMELQTAYGGADDSDGEGYESDGNEIMLTKTLSL